jgi:hypothetical protein
MVGRLKDMTVPGTRPAGAPSIASCGPPLPRLRRARGGDGGLTSMPTTSATLGTSFGGRCSSHRSNEPSPRRARARRVSAMHSARARRVQRPQAAVGHGEGPRHNHVTSLKGAGGGARCRHDFALTPRAGALVNGQRPSELERPRARRTNRVGGPESARWNPTGVILQQLGGRPTRPRRTCGHGLRSTPTRRARVG